MRGQLAALDHNQHSGRTQAKRADGELRYHRKWIRRSKRWTICPVLVDKEYKHVPALMSAVLERHVSDEVSIRSQSVLSQDDPRRLASTIASAQPVATSTLVAEHVSRYR